MNSEGRASRLLLNFFRGRVDTKHYQRVSTYTSTGDLVQRNQMHDHHGLILAHQQLIRFDGMEHTRERVWNGLPGPFIDVVGTQSQHVSVVVHIVLHVIHKSVHVYAAAVEGQREVGVRNLHAPRIDLRLVQLGAHLTRFKWLE
ncbi:hypothetical protein Mapa_012198 [Marchantia paleacea]|nr:hypothetical protein Mapa_012198 [Marchantia paleacea]